MIVEFPKKKNLWKAFLAFSIWSALRHGKQTFLVGSSLGH